MKSIKAVSWILIAGFMASYFLHWMAGFVVTALLPLFLKLRPGTAFLYAFVGLFLLWSGFAWWQDQANNSILSEQVGNLLGGVSPLSLILITGLIGGIGGGLSALLIGVVRRGTPE